MSSPNKPDTTPNRARYVRFRKEEEQTRSSEKTKHENKGPLLNKGRVKQINMNRSLEKQVRELQDGLKKEVRRREAIKSSLGNTYVGMDEEEGSLFYHIVTNVIQAPRRAVCMIANRMTLFSWWVGMWANEGLSIWRIENKWLELKNAKELLEQEKISLEEHLNYMQKIIDEKNNALSRERQLNQDLLDKIQKIGIAAGCSCGNSKDSNQQLKIIYETMNSLSNSVDQIKKKLESSSTDMDTVYERVLAMLENQKRLESHEKALEEMLKYMALLCEKAKLEGSKSKGAKHNCLSCNSCRLGGNIEQVERIGEMRPEITDDTNDSAESDSNETTVYYSNIDADGNEIIETKLVTPVTGARRNHLLRNMHKILKKTVSNQYNYRFFSFVTLTALACVVAYSYFTSLKKGSAPFYYGILARLASIFSNLWAVIFFL